MPEELEAVRTASRAYGGGGGWGIKASMSTSLEKDSTTSSSSNINNTNIDQHPHQQSQTNPTTASPLHPSPTPPPANKPQNMKPTILPFLLAVVVLTDSASAWTYTWRNSLSQATVASGTGNTGCKGISHAGGKEFSWDRGHWWWDSCCISLYRDGSCGSRNGYSCDDWTKVSSEGISSYKVTDC